MELMRQTLTNLWNSPANDPGLRLVSNALLMLCGALSLPYILRWCWKHTWQVLAFFVGWGLVACFLKAVR